MNDPYQESWLEKLFCHRSQQKKRRKDVTRSAFSRWACQSQSATKRSRQVIALSSMKILQTSERATHSSCRLVTIRTDQMLTDTSPNSTIAIPQSWVTIQSHSTMAWRSVWLCQWRATEATRSNIVHTSSHRRRSCDRRTPVRPTTVTSRSWSSCKLKCKANWDSCRRCSIWALNWFKPNVSSSNLSISTTCWLKALRMSKMPMSRPKSLSASPCECTFSWSSCSTSSYQMLSSCSHEEALTLKDKQLWTCSRRRCLTSHSQGSCKPQRAMIGCRRLAIQPRASRTINHHRTIMNAKDGWTTRESSSSVVVVQPMKYERAQRLRMITSRTQESSRTTNRNLQLTSERRETCSNRHAWR